MRSCLLVALLLPLGLPAQRSPKRTPSDIYVDLRRGRDSARGSKGQPVKTISAALTLLSEPVKRDVDIHVAAGRYAKTGAHGMPGECLQLDKRMRPGVQVRIVGSPDKPTEFVWTGDQRLVWAVQGSWQLENLHIGSFDKKQRGGCEAEGNVKLRLKNVSFRLRSFSGAAIHARRGGWIGLRGRIAINEHLHDAADDETYACILAEDHGVVRFEEHDGAELDMGNGSLSARYYGVVRLGCRTARITTWTDSNAIAIANGGRVDLHDSEVTLCAKRESNTPIGPEHDGHILAEGAKLKIIGKNRCAIALQKASTFTCNHIDLAGEFRIAVWALSDSTFVGRFVGDVNRLEAHTGAHVHVEKIGGKLLKEPLVRSGAMVTLPGGKVIR